MEGKNVSNTYHMKAQELLKPFTPWLMQFHYRENITTLLSQNFRSLVGHFSTLWMKEAGSVK